MKLCFSTLGCTEYSLKEVLELAKRYEIDAIEIRGLDSELDNQKIACFQKENTEKTKAMLEAYKITARVLGTSAAFHAEENYEKALEEGRAAIDIASVLGISGVRVFGNNLKDDPAGAISRVGRGILALCEYAETTGVDVLLEVHGDFVTEESLAPVIERCGLHPRFGLIWDVCHTRVAYPDPRVFFERFAPYIRHVHLKDINGTQHVLPGEGTLPLKEIAKHLTKKRYNGYFSLEWERKWHPELPPIEDALEKFVALF